MGRNYSERLSEFSPQILAEKKKGCVFKDIVKFKEKSFWQNIRKEKQA